MKCSRCGHTTTSGTGPCPSCGASLSQATVGTAVGTDAGTAAVPFDTTGLPPGSTFGATQQGTTTFGGTPRLTSAETAAGSDSGTAIGPLHVGQAFGPRYHIIKMLGIG